MTRNPVCICHPGLTCAELVEVIRDAAYEAITTNLYLYVYNGAFPRRSPIKAFGDDFVTFQ